ncbi:DUF4975 domain-containing protein [Olivibacter sp. SDN3]|nr:DUF4975 domain-containing protein [Olivibacter sp. SDN3]
MYLKEIFLAITLFIGLVACSKDNAPSLEDWPDDYVPRIYPQPTTGWVGDVMPYFYDGKFEIFFLHDATDKEKQRSAGQHPVHKFTTTSLVDYHYAGEMIPYGSVNTQYHLIGTGSTVRVDDTFHFYFTGHNGSNSWLQNNNPGWVSNNNREAVMLATSTDLNSWTQRDDFLLKAPEGYSGFDFRDPHVFYNDEFGEYWLLVSTQQNGKGVLLLFTSDDPSSATWEPVGPLDVEGDYLMLECADIFKMGDLYYLVFAEDWSDSPGTHYRIAHSSKGPWRKPASGQDMFDGHQFYAAKTASDGDKRYAFAWAHRRRPENNSGECTWAGNLIVHEIVRQDDGSLGVRIPDEVQQHFVDAKAVQLTTKSNNVTENGEELILDANANPAELQFEEIKGTQRINAQLELTNASGNISFLFNMDEENNESYTITFEPERQRIAGYNLGEEMTRVPFDLQAGRTYEISLVTDGTVCVLYVDGKVALSNRIYGMQNKSWGVRAEGTQANLSAIQVSNIK